jgi:uncharacterized protein (TIGR00156 family)
MKFFHFLGALGVVSLAANAQPGGFTGPDARPAVTAAEATELPDDSGVRLVGYIVEAIGSEKYTFRDDTGTIVVEIDTHDWKGVSATPETRIEIVGEIDRERRVLQDGRIYGTKVTVEVGAIRLAN